MRATLQIGRHEYTITTEHATSSYGIPVVLRDGDVTDIACEYEADPPPVPIGGHILAGLADAAGIWSGPATRKALANAVLPRLPEQPTGADYDRLIAEFQEEFTRRRAVEESQ